MKPTLLLACDLDRTVLPNGPEPLSDGAIKAFQQFIAQPHVHLAYVSGRSLKLIQDALNQYDIPLPHTAVGDVGTTIYRRQNNNFTIDAGWSNAIAPDWQGQTGQAIHQLIAHLPELRLQEASKQNTFKLSYYTPVQIEKNRLITQIQAILQKNQIKAAVIFSVDQIVNTGLLDILPAHATKLHAVEYLRTSLELTFEQVVYAGDSGNDIEPLTSGYKAIVVHNALPEVIDEVKLIASSKKVEQKIYYATGGYKGMNGNYVAGILEGLQKFGITS